MNALNVAELLHSYEKSEPAMNGIIPGRTGGVSDPLFDHLYS